MLTRRVSLKRGKLRKRSKRASRQQSARQACLRIVRALARGRCECCGRVGCDGHERLSRARGGDPCDPNNVVWLCRECHSRVHLNPEWAEANGWLLPSWEKEHG